MYQRPQIIDTIQKLDWLINLATEQAYLNPNSFQLTQGMNQAKEDWAVACRLRDNGNFREAENRFQVLLNKYPNFVAALFEMARLLNFCGQHQRAVDHLRKATAINSDDPMLYIELGVSYDGLSDKPNELAAYQEVLAITENQQDNLSLVNRWRAMSNIGTTYREMGDSKRSLEWLQKALDFVNKYKDQFGSFYGGLWDKELLITYLQLGKTFYSLDQIEESEKMFLVGAEIGEPRSYLDPQFQQAKFELWRELANTYFCRGKYNKAIEWLQKCLDISPQDQLLLKLMSIYKEKLQSSH